jgi:3-deoxy-manno-octulosonate cytidylyltransferase (CMP-KDO synthetase)
MDPTVKPRNDNDMKTTIIIPARYASTRLPGKPLIKIAGQTMLQRVYQIALEAIKNIADAKILIATDDKRIADHAKEIGADFIMTPISCPTGTDRAWKAVEQLDDKPEFILNLQGDTPFTPPDFITKLIETATHDKNAKVITPVTQLSWKELDKLREHKKQTPFSGTTVILDKNNNALWFSKNIIPAIRKEEKLRQTSKLSPIYRHIGIYGYRYDMRQKYVTLEPTNYEKLEGLEQLRLLENGIAIQAVPVDYQDRPAMSGIDTIEDVKRAEELIRK